MICVVYRGVMICWCFELLLLCCVWCRCAAVCCDRDDVDADVMR